MAFKDSLSKIAKTVGGGATNMANSVAKKSGELVEISKLSVAVASEEDNIKDFYSKIGKIVYEKYENSEELSEDLMEKCNEIKSSNDTIITLKEKMKELKNIKTCTNCGTKMKLDTAFCPKCGEKQEIPEESEESEEKEDDIINESSEEK